MRPYMNLIRKAAPILILFLLLTFFLCALLRPSAQTASSSLEVSRRLVVIDAGHGGPDGGAVSSDGSVKESDINLRITRHLALTLLFCGEQVALTRSGEEDLSSPDAATIREKKVSDLKNRVAAINGSNTSILISIHQNSIPQHPEVRGAQVFYNQSAEAQRLAGTVQKALNSNINGDNEKTAKAIGHEIFLMREVQCPAVLIECGFLSNPEETRRLTDKTYQLELALAMAAGYLSFVSEVDVT